MIEIKPKPPFDFNLTSTLIYLMPPAKYSEGKFSRILRLDSGIYVQVSITSNESVDEPKLFIQIKPEVNEEEKREIKEKISFMFSTKDDLAGFYSIAKKDEILKQATKDLYGLKIQTAPNLFEGLVISFCLQWCSFSRGIQMLDCLIEKYGEKVNNLCAFPTPEALDRASFDELKECKLGFRAERVKWISGRAAEGQNLEKLKTFPDEKLRGELMKIKWVGEWTAEALLLWRFKRYSAFPLDVWSSKVFHAFYQELKDSRLGVIKKFAEDHWGEYKGLAYYYLMCYQKILSRNFKT